MAEKMQQMEIVGVLKRVNHNLYFFAVLRN